MTTRKAFDTGQSMARTVWATLLVLATITAVSLPAQRARDRDFGRSQEEWCREARRSDVCEVQEDTLSNVRSIDVDARGNGGVAVRGWDRSDVHVRARVLVYADSDAEAKQIASEIKLVTTGGRIRVDGPSRERGYWRDRGWSVSFELEVPRSGDLTIAATNGGVSVRDVRGRMDLRTVNGGIALDDVSGDIRGETTNGGVDVRMTSDKWDGPALEVRTVNGGITLALPPNLSAELDARAVNGGINVDFPVTVTGLISGRRELRGTIGSGGPRIRASATNGGITITRR
ncbi:MAG TPA: DUF4097 family beta strand repeat-containing protein [Vicinamibacterales bacterium]|nr:DUF4097 family beta strand repeat-containing protein [Vicinamibacterales bacterium]